MERDDIIEYAFDTHHTAEEGKKIRKKIFMVTALLSIITIIEVALGVLVTNRTGITWEMVKWSFIGMTLLKAAYIVLVFMHLGDEKKSLKYLILVPYAIFIGYLIFIGLTESSYIFDIRQFFGF